MKNDSIYRDETTRAWRTSEGRTRVDVMPHRVGVLATSWGNWDAAGGMWGQFALLRDGRVSFSRDSAAPWSQVTPYRAPDAELGTAVRARARDPKSTYAPNLLVQLTEGCGREYWERQRCHADRAARSAERLRARFNRP